MVVPLAEPHERSGLLSLVYVVSYLGMGVPAVIGGVLVVHGGGLLDTAREYGGAVIVLAAAALAGLLLRRGTQPAAVRES
jgi:predicted MFS family arabinose efflux permease